MSFSASSSQILICLICRRPSISRPRKYPKLLSKKRPLLTLLKKRKEEVFSISLKPKLARLCQISPSKYQPSKSRRRMLNFSKFFHRVITLKQKTKTLISVFCLIYCCIDIRGLPTEYLSFL